MLDKKQIYKKIISSKHSTVYLKCFSYTCSNGFKLSFVKSHITQSTRKLKNNLTERVLNYLSEKELDF